MSPTLHHECTRVPVTALVSCGTLLVAAEGSFLRFYRARDFRFVASRRVFEAQSVHGITVFAVEHNESHVTKLVVWGGRLVSALRLVFSGPNAEDLEVHQSEVAKASDWILDLTPRPLGLDDDSVYHAGTCVAVTAHNALLQVNIQRGDDSSSPFRVTLKELTSSSRSILYSAHVFCESRECILVAAGTAFGEIIFWSAQHIDQDEYTPRIHRVFLGHEGSIFGVRISKELPSNCCQQLKRVIASCSDDRTIRIWDVSDIDISAAASAPTKRDPSFERAHHTGFSNEAFDAASSSSSECLAIGWGHISRVWKVQFMESTPCDGTLLLLSAGEDATLRTWRLKPTGDKGASLPYALHEEDCASYHNGKNIWSFAVQSTQRGQRHVVCGAADSKITAYPLRILESSTRVYEYTVQDMLSQLQGRMEQGDNEALVKEKSSKKAEFFRSYCALHQGNFLLTTNSGRVLTISLTLVGSINAATLVDKFDDLSGYSVCASHPHSGRAFVAGAGGKVYTYTTNTKSMVEVTTVDGKIGDLFISSLVPGEERNDTVLLTTLMGKQQAELHYISMDSARQLEVVRKVAVPISEQLTGAVITSMAHIVADGKDFLFLGFRRGSIALYGIAHETSEIDENATLFSVIERVHGEETVTALKWTSSPNTSSSGHVLSVGRDGRLATHAVDLLTHHIELVHNLSLPFGPNIEGISSHGSDILVHGFMNKKWVLYNVRTEEEIMDVETGGGHRSWAFQANREDVGGTLIWTRASSMHIYSRPQPNHQVIRAGGHGREVKAVAISPDASRPLIATGAEDTDIKIFEYVDGDLRCKRTIRRHTTGIQHLQWSKDGTYLFSSGGCEEFYIWRVRSLPSPMDIGVVCEYAYVPDSEYADLRIMSFDVREAGSSYIVAMVFSDSSLKVYKYGSTETQNWRPLAKGTYFTSCLTQCLFLSDDQVLTAGTDGHAVAWHLPTAEPQSIIIDLKWRQPARIHQSSSKSMSSQSLEDCNLLVASGGDDASLAIFVAGTVSGSKKGSADTGYIRCPTVVIRTHASAITACAVIKHEAQIFVVTSGNDQWVRLWKVDVINGRGDEESIKVTRVSRVETSVADVSSMAVMKMPGQDAAARVLICGVGMEIIRLDLDI